MGACELQEELERFCAAFAKAAKERDELKELVTRLNAENFQQSSMIVSLTAEKALMEKELEELKAWVRTLEEEKEKLRQSREAWVRAAVEGQR